MRQNERQLEAVSNAPTAYAETVIYTHEPNGYQEDVCIGYLKAVFGMGLDWLECQLWLILDGGGGSKQERRLNVDYKRLASA